MSNILRSLKQIFPPYLLLMVFFPLITGLFIDYRLINSRDIAINLVWLSIFTVPAAISGSRLIYLTAAFIWFLAGLIEIAHWSISGGPLTVTSILVMSNTNFSEANEFLNLKATAVLLVLIPYVFVFYLVLRNIPNYQNFRYRFYLLVPVLIISLVFIGENALHNRLVRKGIPQISKVGFSFADQINLYQEVTKNVEPERVEATALAVAERQTFVIILDESASRRHMSIYGYPRETNPLLSRRNDLIIFDDVVSPYSNTIQSVLSIMSESNLENKKNFNESIDLIDVFHSAGFKTYWISNQPPMGIWENLVTVFANQADEKIFVNATTNSSMEATTTSSFDEKLFSPFLNVLKEDEPLKLIVLHLMGSHSAYNKRYPGRFEKFSGEGKVERTKAEYDNSRLYNDFIVDSLLNILNSNSEQYDDNSIAAAVLLSDHGENVYDELNRAGHDYSGELPASNVEIPFLVWLSENYRNKLRDKTEVIDNNKSKAFVSDDLFHAIIDLAFIKVAEFNKERSIFNSHFDTSRKRVLVDGKDYDEAIE